MPEQCGDCGHTITTVILRDTAFDLCRNVDNLL